jgi:hypothetical protein
METTEKIVECYCRYVRKWFTIGNIKCGGQFEIDLLALELLPTGKLNRYHIETSVSISSAFAKLTAREFSKEKLKIREKKPTQRRTLGYFVERKFGAPEILKELKERGFDGDNCRRIIVTWGWTDEAKEQADKQNICLWDFRNLLTEIGALCRKEHGYFVDDTLRTLQLFIRSGKI